MDGIDRLSGLPDSILHRILSLLDMKASVRSSILSRRWRCVWKCVPDLSFLRSSFYIGDGLSLQFADEFMSLRGDNGVRKITFHVDFRCSTDVDVFDRVMRHGASHGIQQLSVFGNGSRFSKVIESVCTCYQSLKDLELLQLRVDEETVDVWSGLKFLETLTLNSCCIDGIGAVPHGGFANFPKLKTLKLISCLSANECPTSVLKVSAPQLLNLEIDAGVFASVEVVAPKVQSFCFKFGYFHDLPTKLSKLDLPSLNHAIVDLLGKSYMLSSDVSDNDVFDDDVSDNESEKQVLLDGCVNLFNGLYNAQSLNLLFDNFEMLTQIYNLVKHQPSPFKRMKSFNLNYAEGSHKVPYQVVHYFMDGSPIEEDKHLTVEKGAKGDRLVRGKQIF